MTSKLIHEVGEALYGPRWQSEMARDLGVADRTVRRWAAGDFEVPPGVWSDLHKVAIKHNARLAKIIPKLAALTPGAG